MTLYPFNVGQSATDHKLSRLLKYTEAACCG